MNLKVFRGARDRDQEWGNNIVNKYLQTQEVLYGFPPVHTFYSFRGSALSIIARKTVEATAQTVADHKVGSSTYRRHYDTGLGDVDPMGMAIDGKSGSFEENESSSGELSAVVTRANFLKVRSTLLQLSRSLPFKT